MRLVIYIGIENFLAIRLFKFEDLNEGKKKKKSRLLLREDSNHSLKMSNNYTMFSLIVIFTLLFEI